VSPEYSVNRNLTQDFQHLEEPTIKRRLLQGPINKNHLNLNVYSISIKELILVIIDSNVLIEDKCILY